MALIIMNSIDILEGVKNVDDDHDIFFVERLHGEAIEQRLHQDKGLMQ